MNELKELFKNRSTLTNLVIVLVMLVGLPIGLGLVRQQQNLRSQAGSEPIVFVEGECIKKRDDGGNFAVCANIELELTSPLGPGADDGSGDASPSATVAATTASSSSPSASPTFTPRFTPSPTPSPTAGNGQNCDRNNFDRNTWQKSSESKCSKNGLKVVNYLCSGKKYKEKVSCSTASPTASSSSTSSPAASSTSSRTATPAGSATATASSNNGNAPQVITTNYKIAESPKELQTAPWLPYPISPLFTSYILKNVEPGKKVLFAQFIDSEKTLSEILSQDIELVGPPPIIANINCARSLTGAGLSVSISGSQFGDKSGWVVLKDAGKFNYLTTSSWTDEEISGSVSAGKGDADGNKLVVTVVRPDLTQSEGVCQVGGVSNIALGAKLFCRTLSDSDTDGVEVVVAETKPGGKVVKELNATIDKNGILQGLKSQFETGQEYIVSVKAPHSLRRVSTTFIAGDGTVQLVFRETGVDDGNQNVLPIGDIAPLSNEDGKIDNRDKFELIREFGLTSEEGVLKAADFNEDKLVNSIDWACMRYDFPSPGQTAADDPEPKPGAF